MQNQLQQFPQRAKKAPLDEDVTMEMEPNPFIQVRDGEVSKLEAVSINLSHFDLLQVRPVREGRRYLLWRKITG